MVRKIDNRGSNGTNGHSRVKFRYSDGERYMDFEMQGGSDELTNGLKSLALALSNKEAVAPRVLAAPKGQATAAAAAAVVSPSEEDAIENGETAEPETEGNDEVEQFEG